MFCNSPHNLQCTCFCSIWLMVTYLVWIVLTPMHLRVPWYLISPQHYPTDFHKEFPHSAIFFSKNKQMGNIAKSKSIKITRKIHQESLLFMLVRKCFQFIGGRARSKEIINKWLFYHEGFQVFQLSENTNEILKDPYHGEMETAENRTYRTLAQSLKKNSCRLWRTRWSHHYRR